MFQPGEGGASAQRSFVDRHDVRFIGAVPGRYALSDGRCSRAGKIDIYACRLCSISTRVAVVTGPVAAAVGDVVTAHFDEFGIMRGKITRRLPSGFVLDLLLTEPERSKLGAKIAWHKRRVQEHLPDKRDHKRILPRDPCTVLTLAKGIQLPCFVIDISQSGVAISAEIWPTLGTPMAVGKLVGRVVRYLDVGFALQFVQLHELDRLETMMAPVVGLKQASSEPSKSAAA